MKNKIVHIGKSTTEENEILNILSEECAEVIQAISKIFRFGWESAHPSNPEYINRMHLEEELGDLQAMIGILIDKNIIDMDKIELAAQNKLMKLMKYSNIVL